RTLPSPAFRTNFPNTSADASPQSQTAAADPAAGPNGCAPRPEGTKTLPDPKKETGCGAWRGPAQKPEIKHRDRPRGSNGPDRRARRGEARDPLGRGRALRQIQGQDRARLSARTAGSGAH